MTRSASAVRIIYFSICSNNYLAYARTLYASLREAGVENEFYLFLVDEVARRFPVEDLEFPCIETRDIGIANYFDMAARYSVMEMNTAVKPFVISWIHEHLDADAAVYLDPDIFVLKPLDHVHALLEEGANVVLTPHSTGPLDDGGDPDDIRIMRTGAYNLGFGAFRRSEATTALMTWWGEHLKSKCVVDLDNGLFVDQKFMDLAPSYTDKTAILRHPGYNVAYWNLIHRPITGNHEAGWRSAGEDLHFFHFSGVVPGDRSVFSKHQNRFDRTNIGDLTQLLDRYLDDLDRFRMLNGIKLSDVPYFYNNLANGLRFTDDMRMVYATAQRPGPRSYDDCFGPDLNLYLTLEPSVPQDESAPITRLAFAIWRRRSDVQSVYPLNTAQGRKGLSNWFVSSGFREHRVPAPISEAFLRSLAEKDPGSSRSNGSRLEPGLGIYGYFRTESGVGAGARANWRAARHAGIASKAYGLATGSFDDKLVSDIPLSQGPCLYDTVLLHINADQVIHIDSIVDRARLSGRYRIGYWAWELSQFPDEWQRAFDKVDEIWVPSTFVAEAVSRRTQKPVHVIPHPVPIPEVSEDREDLRAKFGLPADRFVFLTAFDFNSFVTRKNPMAVVRAFQDAFPAKDDPLGPLLVVKCHGRVGRDLASESLNDALRSDKRIIVIDKVLETEDVLRLQAASDAFVSLHRSEGFGLWMAECMALGKPVICTNYSGNIDFARASNALPIGYTLRSVQATEYPFGEGQWWAEPNHDEAVAAFSAVASDAALRDRIGTAARRDIERLLSLDAIGALIRARLQARDRDASRATTLEQSYAA